MFELVSALIYPVFVLLLLGLGFVSGSIVHRRHIADLDRRELALSGFALSNLKTAQGRDSALVTGSVVIAYDFFRRIAVVLRKIIGGRFRMHENLMIRARREAVLRMAEAAQQQGASGVHNIRLVSANLGSSGSAMGGCEVVAYGTAVWD